MRAAQLLLTIPVVLALARPVYGQSDTAELVGRVVDRDTRAPIAGAYLAVVETGRQGRSDDSGRFAFGGLALGTYHLRALAIGYFATTFELRALTGSRAEYTLVMTPYPVVMDTVKVRAEQDGDWRSPAAFERRRARGIGYFLTRSDIDAREANSLGDLLQSVPGVVTMCRMAECRTVITRSGRGCTPEWYVDGFPATFAGGPEFPSRFIENIEVYPNATDAPIEMQRPGQRCGVIAIWTRRKP